MSWPEALLALLLSHVVGDVLLQTDRQAQGKSRGLGDATGRRALAVHIGSYTLAFVPALVWIGVQTDAVHAVAVALIVAVTHLIIDDGRLVAAWMHAVKHTAHPSPGLSIAVDQTFHALCLFGAALVAAA